MKTLFLAMILVLGTLLLGVPGAGAQTINFDTVSSGTPIDTVYPGLTFSCTYSPNPSVCSLGGGHVYAVNSVQAFNSPNIVSTYVNPGGIYGQQDNITGAIEVAFATPQSIVSIEAYPFLAPEGLGPNGYAYIQAYTSTFVPLGEVNDNTLNAYNPLSISSAGNISYVVIGDVQGNNTLSLFDNLCYSTSSTGCSANNGGGGPAATPEPATLVLWALGMAAIVLKLKV